MKEYIQIAIRSPRRTIEGSIGRKIMAPLLNNHRLIPNKMSHNGDRITEPFDPDSWLLHWASKATIRTAGEALDFYQDFAWKRTRTVKYAASIVHSTVNRRGTVVPATLALRSSWAEEIPWLDIFKEWCEILLPQVGMLHLFSGSDLDETRKNDNFQIGSFGPALNPEIQDFGWAMYYGPAFADKLNIQKIIDNGFLADSSAGGVIVTVTPELRDIARNPSEYKNRRAQMRKCFPDGFFVVDS